MSVAANSSAIAATKNWNVRTRTLRSSGWWLARVRPLPHICVPAGRTTRNIMAVWRPEIEKAQKTFSRVQANASSRRRTAVIILTHDRPPRIDQLVARRRAEVGDVRRVDHRTGARRRPPARPSLSRRTRPRHRPLLARRDPRAPARGAPDRAGHDRRKPHRVRPRLECGGPGHAGADRRGPARG